MKKPLALIILDGFGYNPRDYGNAIAAAKKPTIDSLYANCPHTLIGASGMDVGLPDGQMGNLEVGHTNIGPNRLSGIDAHLKIDRGRRFLQKFRPDRSYRKL